MMPNNYTFIVITIVFIMTIIFIKFLAIKKKDNKFVKIANVKIKFLNKGITNLLNDIQKNAMLHNINFMIESFKFYFEHRNDADKYLKNISTELRISLINRSKRILSDEYYKNKNEIDVFKNYCTGFDKISIINKISILEEELDQYYNLIIEEKNFILPNLIYEVSKKSHTI